MDVRLSAGGFDSVGVTLSWRQKCTSRVERMGSCRLYCNLGEMFGTHHGAYTSNGYFFCILDLGPPNTDNLLWAIPDITAWGGGVFLSPPPPRHI